MQHGNIKTKKPKSESWNKKAGSREAGVILQFTPGLQTSKTYFLNLNQLKVGFHLTEIDSIRHPVSIIIPAIPLYCVFSRRQMIINQGAYFLTEKVEY